MKQPAGWVLGGVALLVLIGTTRGRFGTAPLLEDLVPYLGTLFAIVFVCVQIGLCFWFRTTIGLAWIAGAFVVGLTAGGIYEAVWRRPTMEESNPAMAEVLRQHDIETPEYDWTRHRIVTGACASALALGVGLATGKL